MLHERSASVGTTFVHICGLIEHTVLWGSDFATIKEPKGWQITWSFHFNVTGIWEISYILFHGGQLFEVAAGSEIMDPNSS